MTRQPLPPAARRAAALGAAAIALLGLNAGSRAASPAIVASTGPAAVDPTQWGAVTAPVYGLAQTGTYAGADLFAGPNQGAGYFDAVLPNGKIVTPAGTTVQTGMNPLGVATTPDGRFVITTNDDERSIATSRTNGANGASLRNPTLIGGYSLTVLNASTLAVVSHVTTLGPLFIGLQVKSAPGGGYTVYASGGAQNAVLAISLNADGTYASKVTIPVAPITPASAGYASNYTLNPAYAAQLKATGAAADNDFPEGSGNNGFSNFATQIGGTATAPVYGEKITFPAGSALSPDGRYLYVACNGDNSLAVIDTTTNAVVKQLPVGYFPFGVSVSPDGSRVMVTNWGVQPYKFLGAQYDGSGLLAGLASVAPGQNASGLFYVPATSMTGANPQTSSVSVVSVPGGNPAAAGVLGAVYQGQPGGLDALYNVGETHPTASAIVRRGLVQVEYVARSNDDSLGIILVNNARPLGSFDLTPLPLTLTDGHRVHGSYPEALAASPDGTRLYVAEAGLNSVAVLDVTVPTQPRLLGRIPTDWYPTGLALSPDGDTLYVTNAKGVGEDINPATTGNPTATGVESFSNSNSIFGTLQAVNVNPATATFDNTTALADNYHVQDPSTLDSTVVPLGGAASPVIKHVIFILKENKTFDSVLGNQSHFGPYASLTFNDRSGAPYSDAEYGLVNGFTQLVPNTQALADTFAAAVNYFSDAEESDAGHQFSASGTASDYSERTLLVKSGRGLLVNKNFEPEDYPEGGYIFNNAARNGVSFKDYGALIRVDGTDNGFSYPASLVDPASGVSGSGTAAVGSGAATTTSAPPLPALAANTTGLLASAPPSPQGDVTSPTTAPGGQSALGQSYFLKNPILAVLGQANANGEPHLDVKYPGYNFSISDERRAKEFIADFDRMARAGTLPTYLYIYLPNDHTGPVYANPSITGANLIADNDIALGQVVQHLMKSPVYYNPADGTGAAIVITEDDAQSGYDHIHPHRTPMVVVSPYAKLATTPDSGGIGYVATHHYVTASIVKTEELLLGLPPNNYGDLFATDLRDMFQDTYNGVHLDATGLHLLNAAGTTVGSFNPNVTYVASAEGTRIWKLVAKLDTSGPDRDSARLSSLTLLSMNADALHRLAARRGHLHAAAYRLAQAHLYRQALAVVSGPATGDSDD